jgi:hypothetical protein
MAVPMARRPKADRWFFALVPLVLAIAIVFGFSRSWFFRPFLPAAPHPPELTPLIAFHGAVFSLWLVLTIVQPLLIGANRRDLHRSLGYAGAFLAALMAILMPVTAIASMRMGDIGDFDASGLFRVVNLALACEFSVVMFLAIHYRSRPDFHKRLILLALVPLLPLALSRWPVVTGPPLFVCDLVIVAGCIYDKFSKGHIHTVWRWSLPLMLAAGVLTIAIGIQPAAQRFADRIVQTRWTF